MRHRVLPGLVSAAALALFALPAWAQSASTGTVSGQVVDQQNASIPGAAVVLTDTGTRAQLNTLSNDAGRYIFVDVPPGAYDLSVTKHGFATFKANAQQVRVGVVLTINARLEVGTTSTTIEVSSV